jgi:hypothetical protein
LPAVSLDRLLVLEQRAADATVLAAVAEYEMARDAAR